MSVRDDIMDEVLDALKLLRSSNDYNVKLADDPVPLLTNYLTLTKDQTPILMMVDQGDDTLLAKSPTETFIGIEIRLIGFTRRDTWEETKAELNAIIAAVQQLIDSPPDLGTAILALQYTGGLGHYFDDAQKYGHTTILIRVLYKVTNGTF